MNQVVHVDILVEVSNCGSSSPVVFTHEEIGDPFKIYTKHNHTIIKIVHMYRFIFDISGQYEYNYTYGP